MLKLLLIFILTSLSSWAADDHATISLQRFDKKLVVTVHHDEGWHTYWKNPGDSGIASSFKFSSNNKPLTLKAYEWPVPEKHLEAGDILTIGYEGKQHFFFDEAPGNIDAHIHVLICKDICIPGEAKLTLKAGQNFIANRSISAYAENDLKEAFSNLPQEAKLPPQFE